MPEAKSQAEALQLGMKTYHGPPCKKNPAHRRRYTSSRVCLECSRERARRNYKRRTERESPKIPGDFTDPLTVEESQTLLACGTFAIRSAWRAQLGLPQLGHFSHEITALQEVPGEKPPSGLVGEQQEHRYAYLHATRHMDGSALYRIPELRHEAAPTT